MDTGTTNRRNVTSDTVALAQLTVGTRDRGNVA